jgi:hypothetical protein
MIESQANTKIRKIPINQKLTATFEHDKKVSRGEYIFSENGKPYQDVKTGLITTFSQRCIEVWIQIKWYGMGNR